MKKTAVMYLVIFCLGAWIAALNIGMHWLAGEALPMPSSHVWHDGVLLVGGYFVGRIVSEYIL